MRIIVAGSRTIAVHACLGALDMLIRREAFDVTEIVSGGARGPDTAGEIWARDHGVPVKKFLPNWDRHGKRAGILRNEEMVAYAARVEGSVLIAFWDGESPGTKHMIATARKRGLRRYVRRVGPFPRR